MNRMATQNNEQERYSEADKQRFWAKVLKVEGGCWEWQATRIKAGYGHINIGGRILRAHRVSYELAQSPIPDGLCVLHKCDNRPCVNPDHLFLGTKKDNFWDAVQKGRLSRTPNPSRLTQTHCKRGHELSGNNLAGNGLTKQGAPMRDCRICRNERRRTRSAIARSKRTAKQHCKRGHELLPENIRPGRKRSCLACYREQHRRNDALYRASKRSNPPAASA